MRRGAPVPWVLRSSHRRRGTRRAPGPRISCANTSPTDQCRRMPRADVPVARGARAGSRAVVDPAPGKLLSGLLDVTAGRGARLSLVIVAGENSAEVCGTGRTDAREPLRAVRAQSTTGRFGGVEDVPLGRLSRRPQRRGRVLRIRRPSRTCSAPARFQTIGQQGVEMASAGFE